MPTAAHPRARRGPYRGLWIFLAVVIPAFIVAFAPTYFKGRTFSLPDVTTMVHVHTALMMLWVLMLIAQAFLIRARKYAIHRLIGRSSFVVVPLIALSTIVLTVETLGRKPEIAPQDYRIEIFTWGQVIPFVLAWALAMMYRRKTPIHVRFMVSTIFATASAYVFRILLNWFTWIPGMNVAENPANIENVAAANGSVIVLMLLGLIALDWRLGIKRSPFWLVAITTVITHIGFFTFTKTDWWTSFVDWYAAFG